MSERKKPPNLELSKKDGHKLPDEEKMRNVLRELRVKNVNVEAGLARLEKLIQSPNSHCTVEQVRQSMILRQDYCLESKEILEKCRMVVTPHVLNLVRPNQKLLFGEINISNITPEFYASESGTNIAIVGPRNLRRKTVGALRLADILVSVNCCLVSDWLNAGPSKESGSDKSARAIRALQRFQSQLISLVKSTNSPNLVFGVLRDAPIGSLMALTGDWTQVEIIHLPNEPSVGLGFGIVGGASTGVVIKTILPGSAADKDKRLHAGDRILQIGRINVQGFSSQQVASLLRQHETTIELIVGRSIAITDKDNVLTSSCWTMATKTALNPGTLEEAIQAHVVLEPATSQQESVEKTTKNGNHTGSTNEPTTSQTPQTSSESADKKDHHNQSSQQPSSSNQTQSRSNSSRPSKTPSTDLPMSLKNLQEMALTTFCSENWVQDKYETIEVLLERDPDLGLGITVAGYVHRKEEITGVFVKSLVKNSSAHLSKQIQVHDLIVEVNGKNLESRRHAEAVRTLIKSGPKVQLKMIRFHAESPQAICLKLLHEQELATQIQDMQSNLIDYKSYWQNRLGSDYEIIVVNLKPEKYQGDEANLGLSLEGTVDIVDGSQLCPHHYIESKSGPAAQTGLLKAGDELLQVNEVALYGESHVTVRQELGKAAKRAVESDGEVRLFLCRKAHQINLYMPSLEQSLPLAYSLLAAAHDSRLFKAKSEFTLSSDNDEQIFFRDLSKKLRSRSLEQLSGLAIWNCRPIIVSLEKDSRGLGFSVIDYQDPLHHRESVIVIRSLVPGGVAQADGRITPGDRLLFVNDVDLSNSTLQNAVEVLKRAPMGLVKIGIAKPIPVNELDVCRHSPIITRSERLLARLKRKRLHFGSSNHLSGSTLLDTNTLISGGSSQEEIWVGADLYRRLNPQLYFPSSGSGTPTTPRSHCSMFSWTPCSSRSISPVGSPISLKGSWSYDVVQLPYNLERSVTLMKGALPLGIVVDANVDKSINGCVVKSICSKKAVGRDGRIQVGDYIIRLNTENMRNVTNSQAKSIIKRTNLIGTQCNVTYITATDARTYTQQFHHPPQELTHPTVNRLSPKVFPKFYKSPFLGRRSDQMSPRALALRNQLSQDSFDEPMMPSTSAQAIQADNLVKDTLAQLSVEGRKKMDEMTEQFIKSVLDDTAIEIANYYRTPDFVARNKQPIDSSQSDSNAKTSKVRLKSEERSPSPPLPPPPPMTAAQSKPVQTNNELAAALSTAPKEAERKLSNGEVGHQSRSTEKPVKGPVNFANTTTPSSSSTMKVTNEPTAQASQTNDQAQKRNNFWGEARTVVLNREPNETFGVSIVGGRIEVSQKGGLPGTGNTVNGIFIKSVMPNSPAGRSSKIFMGDRIIQVNDTDLKNATHEQAVHAIKNTKNPVRFVVQSLQSFSPDKFSHRSPLDSNEPLRQQKVEIIHQQSNKKETQQSSSIPLQPTEPMELEVKERIETKPAQKPEVPPKPSIAPKTSTPLKSATEVDEEQPTTSTATKSLLQLRESMRKKVEPESAAALAKDASDDEEEDRFCYTKKKIQHKYGELPGQPELIKLVNIPPNGLGLSLAGKNENQKKSVFVVDIKSTSQLPLQIGDELLEINGKVLFGLSHQSASLKIRECCEGDELALLILRTDSKQADDDPTKPEDRSADIHVEIQTAGEDTSANNSQTELTPKLSLPSDLHNNNATANKLSHPNDNNHTPSSLHDVSQTISLQSSPAHFGAEARRKKSWQMEQKVSIETGKETLIEIDKDGKGLGLSIVGGTDTVLGSIVIHEVYPDGAAAIDNRVKPGDQILEVNGTSLNLTHDQAISILRRTPAKVRLLIYRDVNLQLSLLDPTQIYNIHEVELQKKPGKGLGISIVGRKDEPGVYISEIVKGGVAEQDGRLFQGDQILNVCGQDVSAKLQEDVATLLKTITGKVTIKVGRWKLTDAANRVHAAQPASRTSQPSSAVASPQVQRQQPPTIAPVVPTTSTQVSEPSAPSTNGTTTKQVLPGDGDEDRRVPSPAPQPSFGGYMASEIPQVTIQDGQRLASELSPVSEEPGSSTDLKSLTEPAESGMLNIHEDGSENLLVHLKKADGYQWGMGIGKRPRGILITSLQPGSTAAEKLLVGDRIMAVNSTVITDQHSAVTLIKSSSNDVKLQLARPSTMSSF